MTTALTFEHARRLLSNCAGVIVVTDETRQLVSPNIHHNDEAKYFMVLEWMSSLLEGAGVSVLFFKKEDNEMVESGPISLFMKSLGGRVIELIPLSPMGIA